MRESNDYLYEGFIDQVKGCLTEAEGGGSGYQTTTVEITTNMTIALDTRNILFANIPSDHIAVAYLTKSNRYDNPDSVGQMLVCISGYTKDYAIRTLINSAGERTYGNTTISSSAKLGSYAGDIFTVVDLGVQPF